MEDQEASIIPRDYVLVFEDDGTKYCFAPSRHIMANALRSSPETLRRKLESTQRYRQWLKEQREKGKMYEPKFIWTEEMLNDENIYETFRDGLKKRDGAYLLANTTPGDAVTKLTVKGEDLTASVKSKGRRGKERPAYYDGVVLRSPFLDEYGHPNLIEMSCPCGDNEHGKESGSKKRTWVECLHLAAMEQEFYERMYSDDSQIEIKSSGVVRRGLQRGLFSPFGFVDNWVFIGGKFVPKNKHLGALEQDVLVNYYVLGDNHFSINQRLLSLSETVSKWTIHAMRNGQITREVLQQRRAGDLTRDEQRVISRFKKAIHKLGYRHNGYCLEMGRPAEHYEHKDFAVNLIPEELIYVSRGAAVKQPRPFGVYDGETNPFKLLGDRGYKLRYDDRTMRERPMKVGAMTAVRLPESEDPRKMKITVPRAIKNKLRKKVRKAKPDGWETAEKYARVHY